MGAALHRITLRQFNQGAIPRTRLKRIVRENLGYIFRRRAELFSPQNRSWTARRARARIALHRVALSSDHAGYHALLFASQVLAELNVPVLNFGPTEDLITELGTLDHPIMVLPAVEALKERQVTRAILCCGSGTGVMIDANMLGQPTVKAVSPVNVVRGREHNNARVLTIGETMVAGKELTILDMLRSVILFLSTPFIREPSRYEERNVQMDWIRRLSIVAAERGIGSIVDLPEFASALEQCPELADIYVVKANEAISRGDLVLAAIFIEKYLAVGSHGKNFYAFLGSFLKVLPEEASLAGVIARIGEILGEARPT